MKNSLWQQSIQFYKKDKLSAWILGITSGLFLGTLNLLNLFVPSIVLILVPFVIAPFIFASMVIHVGFQFGTPLTFRLHFRLFRSYFFPSNSSSFSLIGSFLKYLLCYIALNFLFSLVAIGICSIISYVDLYTMYQKLVDFIYSFEGSFSSLEEVLGDVYYMYEYYTLISSLPSIILSTGYFIFLMSFNSLNIYPRMNAKISPAGITQITRQTLKRCKKSFLKDYFSLNWPLIVIYFVSSITVVIVGLMFTRDISYLSTFAISGFFILSSFFFPFYFSNMQVVYLRHQDDYRRVSKDLAKEMMEQIQSRIDISEEQKQVIEDFANELKDEEDNNPEIDNKEEDEDNKKT